DFKWIMSCFESRANFIYSRDITVNYFLGGVSANAEEHGRECVRVAQERFPSLTPAEAGGLYHSVFAFPTFPTIPGRPTDRSDFLRGLLSRHSDDCELLTAIARALIADSDRRYRQAAARVAEPPSTRSSSVKDRMKSILQGHPTTYRAVRRLYRGMIKT